MIAEGFISGVASGIVIGLFFGDFEVGKRCWERHEQIQYLRKLITKQKKQMCEADHVLGPPTDDSMATDIWRKSLFGSMRRQIETTLDGRCHRLSFDESNGIKEVLREVGDVPDRFIRRSKAYNDLFEKLESLKWLKLSKGPYLEG